MEDLINKYLPITRPLEDTTEYSPTYFYDNIVTQLIPDILKLQLTGIPISLEKVRDVETTVTEVLTSVESRLKSNPIMQRYLEHVKELKQADKKSTIQAKAKTISDFITVFNAKNKQHRSFVVNEYFKSLGKEDLIQDEWLAKDLKLVNKVYPTKFITELISGNYSHSSTMIIEQGMQAFAEYKYEIYLKTKLADKLAKIDNLETEDFNCSSPKQKAEFFSWLGIEPEKETKAGSPQWNRAALEDLNKLLTTLIEKEDTNGK